jgi:hypothetical protein
VVSLESLNLPSKIKGNNTTKSLSTDTQLSAKKNVVKNSLNDEKKSKKELDKTSIDINKKFPNVNFTMTGSVVIISNWESVKKEILFINWETGISYIEEFHKYIDYQSIPNTVKITFKDHSTKTYTIKR